MIKFSIKIWVIVIISLLGIFILTVLLCPKKLELDYPLVFVGIGVDYPSRSSREIPTIILKDKFEKLHIFRTQNGYYDEFANYIYNNYSVGDTIKFK